MNFKATNKELFFQLIQIERERQDKKWPNQERQKNVSLPQWGNILGEEFGEFLKEVNDGDNFKAIIELAETAAVCLRIAEVYFDNETLTKAFIAMSERTTKQLPKE
jgi:hypothetical protein